MNIISQQEDTLRAGFRVCNLSNMGRGGGGWARGWFVHRWESIMDFKPAKGEGNPGFATVNWGNAMLLKQL